MRSVVSLALVVSLAGSTGPAAAQEQIVPMPGSLGRAVAREAARLALEPGPAAAAVPQSNAVLTADWSRVRSLKPGTEIAVTVRGSTSESRYIAMSDQSGMDLLNVARLPPDAARALVGVAKDYFLFVSDARRGGVRAGNVRLSPDGAFIDGQKVAELEQVLERVARTDVLEISGVVENHAEAWTGAFIGLAAVLGVGLAANVGCQTFHEFSPGGSPYDEEVCDRRNVLFLWSAIGAGSGAAIGAAIGAARSGRRPKEIVYRAP